VSLARSSSIDEVRPDPECLISTPHEAADSASSPALSHVGHEKRR